jgi:hypothetical protein
VVIVIASATNGPRVRAVARWVRALVPAAALVVSTPDLGQLERVEDEVAIIVNADELPSGPLSLAAALARATGGGTCHGRVQ